VTVVNDHRRYHLAVWIVIASEALLFSGLFALYWSYRSEYPLEFSTGVTQDIQWMGGTNTFILLTSSFAIAWAIFERRRGRERAAQWSIAAVLVLGLAFLALKLLEWRSHIAEGLVPGHTLFFTLYYFMTGLHALHVIAGLVLVFCVRKRSLVALEVIALYWHFVDVVWVFLWPMFYLMK
jgi:cytochrome c oxidase subunit III